LSTDKLVFAGGFFGNTGANSSYDLYDLVIIPETEPFNNSLASYDSCPGDESQGYVMLHKYISSLFRVAKSLIIVTKPLRCTFPNTLGTL
jgi:hypothetical protein